MAFAAAAVLVSQQTSGLRSADAREAAEVHLIAAAGRHRHSVDVGVIRSALAAARSAGVEIAITDEVGADTFLHLSTSSLCTFNTASRPATHYLLPSICQLLPNTYRTLPANCYLIPT